MPKDPILFYCSGINIVQQILTACSHPTSMEMGTDDITKVINFNAHFPWLLYWLCYVLDQWDTCRHEASSESQHICITEVVVVVVVSLCLFQEKNMPWVAVQDGKSWQLHRDDLNGITPFKCIVTTLRHYLFYIYFQLIFFKNETSSTKFCQTSEWTALIWKYWDFFKFFHPWPSNFMSFKDFILASICHVKFL